MKKVSFGRRQAEKFIRLAYELEHDARRARAAGRSSDADCLNDAANLVGDVGRRLREGE